MSEDPKETSILETVPNKQRTFSASVPKTPDSVDVDLEEITACSLLGPVQKQNRKIPKKFFFQRLLVYNSYYTEYKLIYNL